MAFPFSFGFETPLTPWNDAYLALFFAATGGEADFGKSQGPLAVADASRYIELFEMQSGVSLFELGTYAEVVGGDDPVATAAARAAEARGRGMFPIVVSEDRRLTERACTDPLVAFWGKVGRAEINEGALFAKQRTVLAGVRAATSSAFKTIPANVTILSARVLGTNHQILAEALKGISDPVHLSVDLDVLSPGVAQTSRSLEPGGISWYELMDALALVFSGPGVAALDLTGTATVAPRSPAATLAAQFLARAAGLITAGLGK